MHRSTDRRGGNERRLLWIALVCVTTFSASSFGQQKDKPNSEKVTDRSNEPARKPIPEGLSFANGLYRQKRYELAADEYEKFLASSPTDPNATDARYGLANARLMLGEYKEARQAFQVFIDRDPHDGRFADALYRIGETSVLLGDLPKARESLVEFTKRFENHKFRDAAWVNLGDAQYRLAEYPSAHASYEKALASTKTGRLADRARYGLGLARADEGKAEAAIEILTELAKTGGVEWRDRAWYQIGRTELAAGKAREAVSAFETLEKVTPKSRLIASARLERAVALSQMNKYDDAEALLVPLVESNSRPIAGKAANVLGQVERARGDSKSALATFDRAFKRFRDTSIAPELLFHSAEAAKDLGNLNDARSRFLELVKIEPKDPWADDALLQAAGLAFQAHDNGAARNLAGSLASRYPTSPLIAAAHLIEARAALADDQPKEAIDLLTSILDRDHPAAEIGQRARYYLGLAYKKDGQSAKASEILDALAKTPANVIANDARFLLGQGRFEAGQFAEALGPLEQYLADRPNGEVADHALAYITLSQWEIGRSGDAMATLKTLHDRFPKSKALCPTALRLAEAAFAGKDYEHAVGWFRLASETAPDPLKGKALAGLGWSFMEKGEPEEAAQAFEAVLDQVPDDPLAPEAARMRAYALEAAGKTDEALSAYAVVMLKHAKTDQSGPAALARARLLAKTKKPAEAARAFADFFHDHPKGVEGVALDRVLAEWGWALLDANQGAEADTVFKRLLDEFPQSTRSADARLNLAESAFEEKRYQDVSTLLGPIVADGSKAEASVLQSILYRFGRNQVELKDWKGAGATFDRLIGDYPEGSLRPQARFWRAEVAFQSNDAKLAEEGFAKLIEASPGSTESWAPTARLRRLQCLILLEKWTDALAAAAPFEKDLPKSPLLAEVEYARGRAYQGLARFAEARASYQAVIDARKRGDLAARAQFMIGETYFHQKVYKEALRSFYRVDVLHDDAPTWQATALFEAGKVHEQLAQWTEAAETYERLRAKFPDDPSSAEAKKRIPAVLKHVSESGGSEPEAE